LSQAEFARSCRGLVNAEKFSTTKSLEKDLLKEQPKPKWDC
jgi:hypothetical protein